MVGVKRSKACITCIERKKGCDGQKPTCKQCEKARKTCRGYNRAMTFINKVVQCSPRNFSSSPPTAHARPIESKFTEELMQSAIEEKYLGYFWQSYFPNGQTLPIEIVNSGLGGWMHHCQSLCAIDSTTRHSVLALSISTIAEQEGCTPWVRVLGRKLYTSALQSVAAKLKCPSSRQADSLLASIRLLGLYETLYGEDEGGLTRATNWLAHSHGSIALVKERGPGSFSYDQSHRLFMDWRLQLISLSLISRKETFLNNPDWSTTPWEHTCKTPYDILLDILTGVPSILEAIDMLLDSNNVEHKPENWRLLGHEYLQLESELAQWYRMFGEIILSPKQDSYITDVVTPHNLATAQLSTLYQATCVIVYGMIGKILVENGKFNLGERYTDPSLFCTRILGTLPLFLNPAVGIFRTRLITFPLSVTMTYLATLPPQDRLEDKALLMNCLNNTSCTTTRKFLLSLMPQNFTFLLRTEVC